MIGIVHLLEELEQHGFHIHKVTPKITCKTFEDNMSCIKIATSHSTRSRTKNLSLSLHHFRSHVINKTITIQHISTKDQIAEILTKALPRVQFRKLCEKLMSWVPLGTTREWEYLMLHTTNPAVYILVINGNGFVIHSFELFNYDQSHVQYSNKLYKTQRYPSGVFVLLFLIVEKQTLQDPKIPFRCICSSFPNHSKTSL